MLYHDPAKALTAVFFTTEQANDEAPNAEQTIEQGLAQAGERATQAADALLAGDLAAASQAGGELLVTYGLPALMAVLILLVAYLLAKFLGRIASTPVRNRVDVTLGTFIGKLIFYLIMICAVLGVLQYFGIGVASFAAVIAAAGFAVGLAFQGTLGNFSSGVLLMVFRPFKVGDVISAAGITAKVYEIDLFTTTLDTFDNRRLIVPNSAIAGGTIENISHHNERRVDVNVGVSYSADLDKTREVLGQAAESLKALMIEGEGRGYQVFLADLGDSSVNWTVRFWTTAPEFWNVKQQLTRAIKVHLDQAGLGIPFPQMDVHLFKQNG